MSIILVISLKIYFYEDAILSLLSYAKDMHPKEIFLLLRGKRFRDGFLIYEFIFPPLTILGNGFASFNPFMIPIDFTIIGSLHSHPSGFLEPSMEDYINMYGAIMVIIAYPYNGLNDIAIFNRNGESISFEVVRNGES